MFTSNIYAKSPTILQNLLLSSRAFVRDLLRNGKKSTTIQYKLAKLEYDEELLKNYHDDLLLKVTSTATNEVPFYKMVATSKLTGFPIISKDLVRKKVSDFLNPNIKDYKIIGSTSGTTGSPLSIPQNMDSVITEHAFIARHLMWAGYQNGDKRAWLRGDLIVPVKQKKPPYWRYSYWENMIMLSSFHMSHAALPLYLKAMVDYGVDIIQAYPSSIVTLAKYLEANNKYYDGKLKSIITSSETLTKEDKELVESRFKCTVFDWYGLFERVAAIASCEHGRYHILSDYSHVELEPAGDNRAEIIGTGFNNKLYPLIRYKTGDHVILSKEDSCPCGRVFPLVDSIEGRIGDYLIAEDGQKVHILNHIPKNIEGILATQFIQDSQNEIIILVVANKPSFSEIQQLALIKKTRAYLGGTMKVSIEIVDTIPRTKSGKTRQAICNV